MILFFTHQSFEWAFSFEEKRMIDFSTETFKLKNFIHDKTSNSLKPDLFGKIIKQNQDFRIDFDSSLWQINSEMMVLGDGFIDKAAHFMSKQNALYYSNVRGKFFNEFISGGDFTIEFRVLFDDVSGKQSIMERMGFVADVYNDKLIKHGFKFYLFKSKLHFDFYNLFHFKQQKKTFNLICKDSFEEDRWYHLVVIYDDDKGILSLYVDGKKEKIIRTTEDMQWGSRQYYPGFWPGLNVPLILGKEMRGKLDEVYFYSIKEKQFLSKKYPETFFEFTSKVLNFPFYNRLHRIHVSGNFDDQFMKVYVKSSSNYFFPDDKNGLFWEKVNVNKPLDFIKKFKKQYVQIKLVLNNYNLSSPVEIQKISLESIKKTPPITPIIRYLTPLYNGFKIVWEKSSESDLAGYHLSYSLMEHEKKTSNKNALKKNSITLYKKQLDKNRQNGSDDLNVFTYEVRGLNSNEKYGVTMRAFDKIDKIQESAPTEIREVIPF